MTTGGDSSNDSTESKKKRSKWILPLLAAGLIGGSFYAGKSYSNQTEKDKTTPVVQVEEAKPDVGDVPKIPISYTTLDGSVIPISNLDQNNDGFIKNQETINLYAKNHNPADPLFKTNLYEADKAWQSDSKSGCIEDLVRDGRQNEFNPEKWGWTINFGNETASEVVKEQTPTPVAAKPIPAKKAPVKSSYSAKNADVQVVGRDFGYDTSKAPKAVPAKNCDTLKVPHLLSKKQEQISWNKEDVHMYFKRFETKPIHSFLPGKQGTDTNAYLLTQAPIHTSQNGNKVKGVKMTVDETGYDVIRAGGMVTGNIITGGRHPALLVGGLRYGLAKGMRMYADAKSPLYAKTDINGLNAAIANTPIGVNKNLFSGNEGQIHSFYVPVGLDGTNGQPRDGLIHRDEVAVVRIDANKPSYNSVDLEQGVCNLFTELELNKTCQAYYLGATDQLVKGVLEGVILGKLTQPKTPSTPSTPPGGNTGGGGYTGGGSGVPTPTPPTPPVTSGGGFIGGSSGIPTYTTGTPVTTSGGSFVGGSSGGNIFYQP